MDENVQQQLLELVRKNYEEIAEDYDRTRRKPATPLWKEVAEYAKQVKAEDRVLDVGCGNGKLLEFLPEEVDYLGVDFSERMIEIAKVRFPEKKFEVVDILDLQRLEESSFDRIFCVAVLHHLPGRQLRIQALRQMRDKLADNGRMIVSVWNLWSQKKMRKRLIKFTLLKIIGKNKMKLGDIVFDWKGSDKQVSSRRYYHAFTKRELRKTIKKAGLTPACVYKDKHNYFAVVGK